MAKRKTKQKAQAQTPKRRKPHRPPSGSGSAAGARGTMGGMRSGLKGFFGTGGKKKPPSAVGRVFDIALWVAVLGAAYVFLSRQCAA
jgi:hypothetical protein